MDRTLYLTIALLLVAGCKPAVDFSGSGGTSYGPAVASDPTFPDDELSVTVETFAQEERYEPQILSVEVYANGEPINASVRLERVHGTAGYCQKATFIVPVDAKTIKAVLVVKHADGVFEVTVPFVHPLFGGDKWRRAGQSTRRIGVADNRPKPEFGNNPIRE